MVGRAALRAGSGRARTEEHREAGEGHEGEEDDRCPAVGVAICPYGRDERHYNLRGQRERRVASTLNGICSQTVLTAKGGTLIS